MIARRISELPVAVVLVLAFCVAYAPEPDETTMPRAAEKPNVLFILADDMRADDVFLVPEAREKIAEKGVSLSLCLSFGYSSWMTPKGAEDGLGSRPFDGLKGIAPRPPQGSPRPLIEIGEVRYSLHKEPPAGTPRGRTAHERTTEALMDDGVWAGIDAGKGFHWAHAVDAAGTELLSRRVENDEADLLGLVEEVLSLAAGNRLAWAIDQPGGSAALLLALLWERGQRVFYVPGLSVDRARDAYRGESKTDAGDARVIADQARMRPDLGELTPGEEDLAELRLFLARRRDLVADRTRTITRLRETLLSLFPALERSLDLNNKGALTLVAHYQTPSAVRRAGRKRVALYLKNRSVKGADVLARKALGAAEAQNVALPAQNVAAAIVSELAEEALGFKARLSALDRELEKRFFARPEARILASLPGMGPVLGSEFLVSVGDLSAFGSADQLAAYAGLVPAARDSGKRVGNHRRMRGGNKVLKRVFYQSAFASLRGSPRSRAFYDRKRAEGKRHTQALIALARRRVNVLWAMLRDGTTFEARPAA